ncbi:hypothetical protein NA8A_17535 [Nitratireductor indicus C115]|uniref:Uncharacterized protein n=1 Tax=Nitratireductor indicus C115 TaxID=1231190 RepID=K2NT66_9HYPH|nr:hypothetical protein [Nitratireductor indicus]EKF40994.1 hypothetical protein NA8A_17535 [Nitratireductor indicus C115]
MPMETPLMVARFAVEAMFAGYFAPIGLIQSGKAEQIASSVLKKRIAANIGQYLADFQKFLDSWLRRSG